MQNLSFSIVVVVAVIFILYFIFFRAISSIRKLRRTINRELEYSDVLLAKFADVAVSEQLSNIDKFGELYFKNPDSLLGYDDEGGHPCSIPKNSHVWKVVEIAARPDNGMSPQANSLVDAVDSELRSTSEYCRFDSAIRYLLIIGIFGTMACLFLETNSFTRISEDNLVQNISWGFLASALAVVMTIYLTWQRYGKFAQDHEKLLAKVSRLTICLLLPAFKQTSEDKFARSVDNFQVGVREMENPLRKIIQLHHELNKEVESHIAVFSELTSRFSQLEDAVKIICSQNGPLITSFKSLTTEMASLGSEMAKIGDGLTNKVVAQLEFQTCSVQSAQKCIEIAASKIEAVPVAFASEIDRCSERVISEVCGLLGDRHDKLLGETAAGQAAITMGIQAQNESFAEFLKSFSSMEENLSSAMRGFSNSLEKGFEQVSDTIKESESSSAGRIVRTLAESSEMLKSSIQTDMEAQQTSFANYQTKFASMEEKLSSTMSGFSKSLEKGFEQVADTIKESESASTGKIVETLAESYEMLQNAIQTDMMAQQASFSDYQTKFASMEENFSSAMISFSKSLEKGFEQVADTIKESESGSTGRIVGTLAESSEMLKSAIQTDMKAQQTSFANYQTKFASMEEKLSKAMSGFSKSLEKGFEQVADTIKESESCSAGVSTAPPPLPTKF